MGNRSVELYHKMPNGSLRCDVCARRCILKDGQVGFCGIRKNENGRIKLLAYGKVESLGIDPIEKKPVLHAFPNSDILSISTTGCNFACQYCQNWDLSQRRKVSGTDMTPEEVVELALKYGCKGIAYTYNEPTIFLEYARDIGLLARKKGLINIFVTNGYETPEAVEVLGDFLDFATVDFKGNGNNEFYRRYVSVTSAEPIFETIKGMLNKNIHVEITDLVVPKIGDNLDDAKSMILRLKDIAGEDLPISFLRFHPDYKLLDLPETSLSTLEKHYNLAKSLGMKYVYLGNVFGDERQNTFCPNCGKVVVRRNAFSTVEVNLTEDSKCKYCGYSIPFILASKPN
ncbi:MAG: AmmeMemoRadiSam system radical SAM enzyme [Candidatus Acidifodinimicrobium sp.]